MEKQYTVGSLYAGVGGICKGFEAEGFELKWANEFDKYACKTYRQNFSHELYECDVANLDIDTLEKVDIITAGFPCQPFSLAGRRGGFLDKRGNHFFTVMTIAEKLETPILFLENVKNFKSHDKGNTFKIVEQQLKLYGYHYKYAILSADKYANIPQNRERIYIVAFRDKDLCDSFDFPIIEPLTLSVKDFLETEDVAPIYYYNDSFPIGAQILREAKEVGKIYQYRRVYLRENKSNLCPTLTASMGLGGHNVPIIKDSHGVRKLTPRECFNLQGFDENYILPITVSNAQLYKQAGNSVVVPLIKKIAHGIKETVSG